MVIFQSDVNIYQRVRVVHGWLIWSSHVEFNSLFLANWGEESPALWGATVEHWHGGGPRVSLRSRRGGCHENPGVNLIKHGVLENGPLITVIFLARNLHSTRGFSSHVQLSEGIKIISFPKISSCIQFLTERIGKAHELENTTWGTVGLWVAVAVKTQMRWTGDVMMLTYADHVVKPWWNKKSMQHTWK